MIAELAFVELPTASFPGGLMDPAAFFPSTLAGWQSLTLQAIALAGAVAAAAKWVIPAGVRVHGTMKKIDRIFDEVTPNGGGSIKDDVKVIKERQVVMGAELEMADARQWAILCSTNHPTWESGPDGGCIRANAALLDLVGRSADQMSGNGWENIIAKDDARRVWKEWSEAVKQRRAFESTYRVTNHMTDKTFLIDGRATPILGRNGELRGWIGVYNNVRPA